MVETPAVHTLKSGLYVVDPAKWARDALNAEWDSSHTDNMTPNVDYAEDHKLVDFGTDGDWITLYQANSVTRAHTLGWTHRSTDYRVSLDMFTSLSRAHLFLMMGEARRIMDVHRKNTFGDVNETNLTGRVWSEWLGPSAPISRSDKSFYRATCDVLIHHVFEEVRT